MNYLLLLCLFLPVLAQAIPEENFVKVWHEKALPYFKSLPSGTLKNPQGLTLKYFFLKNDLNKKSLVLVPGRTEPAIKYAELIYDLKDAGFNIFIMDHQGQGESQRLLKDTHKGHVVYFNNYVKDLEQFIKDVVTIKNDHPLYLIAHSMGGAISTRYMSSHPGVIHKAVLVAPMFKLNTDPYTEAIARIYSKFLILTGKGSDYAPNRGPYIPTENTFEKNDVTHSEERFDRLRVETPILLFQAGSDLVVEPSRQNSFCRNGLCEIIPFPGAYHEILMEKDSIRNEAMKEINSFFGI
jgi:lysophospholipase